MRPYRSAGTMRAFTTDEWRAAIKRCACDLPGAPSQTLPGRPPRRERWSGGKVADLENETHGVRHGGGPTDTGGCRRMAAHARDGRPSGAARGAYRDDRTFTCRLPGDWRTVACGAASHARRRRRPGSRGESAGKSHGSCGGCDTGKMAATRMVAHAPAGRARPDRRGSALDRAAARGAHRGGVRSATLPTTRLSRVEVE